MRKTANRIKTIAHQKLPLAMGLSKTIVARAIPGVINLVSLLEVARTVNIATYGAYSTSLAVAFMVIGSIFGVGTSSILAHFSRHAGRARLGTYLSTLLLIWLCLAVLVTCLVFAASHFIALAIPMISVVLSASLRTLLQELSRVKQDLGSFVLSDIAQATIFGILVFTIIVPTTQAGVILFMYAFSNILPILVNIFSLRFEFRRLGRPSRTMARATLGTGVGLVTTTLMESLLYTGARFAMLWGFGINALGAFSLAVDLATRSIGFVVISAGFMYAPAAFAMRNKLGDRVFRAHLREGAILAAAAATCAFVVIAIAALVPASRAWFPEQFGLAGFCLVSVAVAANRLKKLIIDPVAMATKRVWSLAASNIVGLVTFWGGAVTAVALNVQWGIYLAYMASYVTLAIVAWIVVSAKYAIPRVN